MSDGRPSDPIQALLAQTALKNNLFPPTSRYQGINTDSLTRADGTTVIYLQRRFIPSPAVFRLLQEHAVTQGERLDIISAKYLGDAELFWRIADANGAMRPQDLVAMVARTLRITLPQGITGTSL